MAFDMETLERYCTYQQDPFMAHPILANSNVYVIFGYSQCDQGGPPDNIEDLCSGYSEFDECSSILRSECNMGFDWRFVTLSKEGKLEPSSELYGSDIPDNQDDSNESDD